MAESTIVIAAGFGVLVAAFVIYKLGRTEEAVWGGAMAGFAVGVVAYMFMPIVIGLFSILAIFVLVCLLGPWLLQQGLDAKQRFQEISGNSGAPSVTQDSNMDQLMAELSRRLEHLEDYERRMNQELEVFRDPEASDELRREQAQHLLGGGS